MSDSLRIQNVQTPVIPVVGELVKKNPGTISLGQGVVSYGPPDSAIEQIQRFLENPENHKYQLVDGIPPLLEAINAKLASDNDLQVTDEQRIVVTAGGNMGFMNAVLAIADPGDEIILQTPFYFNHEMAIHLAGCRPVLVPTDGEYQLRPDAMRNAISNKTRAVVTISPNNPTGAVYPQAALREVTRLCADAGIYHIHDEAYEYFTYDGAEHFSPGSLPGSEAHTISLFSLSKSFGFASWRIGYMVIPGHLFMPIKKIQDTILICPPVISQYAAVGALRAGRDYCARKLEEIKRVRRLVWEGLQELKPVCHVPRTAGAFYFLMGLRTEMPAMEVVERLVREHRVAAIPGDAFGLHEGCYLRVSFGALKPQTAQEGVGRLVRGLKAILSRSTVRSTE